MESMRCVSQTMHAFAEVALENVGLKQVDILCVSQDYLSCLPSDCMRTIFTYLKWTDLEVLRRVSQTMHA
ncbi:hypothetical protein PFISCL1PPCAC_17869, partial [Pristionchus fissidentatus]